MRGTACSLIPRPKRPTGMSGEPNRIAFQGLDSTAENKVLYAVDVDFDEGWWLWYYALGSRKSSE
jgi:hypothetical protein